MINNNVPAKPPKNKKKKAEVVPSTKCLYKYLINNVSDPKHNEAKSANSTDATIWDPLLGETVYSYYVISPFSISSATNYGSGVYLKAPIRIIDANIRQIPIAYKKLILSL